MLTSGPAYDRYSAAVQNRRACQDTRDALGGYVETDHPDHPNNSTPERRRAIRNADAALKAATEAMQAAFAGLAATDPASRT